MKQRSLCDVIVSPGHSIRSIIELISKNGVRGVFVCDDDREVLGIIMDADIRRAILRNLDLNASVKTIMKTSPFVISNRLSLQEKKHLLVKSGKILAPVVDDQGRAVDYLYLSDIIDELLTDRGAEDSPVLPPQRILVIGGAGYIGSVLADKLLRQGYKVRVLDILLYGKESLMHLSDNGHDFEFVRGDCRDDETVAQSVEGVDAVVHLGEIVGDPACQVNESFTIEVNYSATHKIVEQCVKRGIRRFIFASSCSVYGQSDDEVDETSELNPVSLYARCKIESERAIQSFQYEHFCPTIFRIATVHGRSFRQRFDLVVNLLAIKALCEGKIQIFGGEQWRPFISVDDICRGFIGALHADRERVRNQIFNLGDSRENYQIGRIGEIIKRFIPEVQLEVLMAQHDMRNYRVSFKRIAKALLFAAERNVADSIRDFISSYRHQGLFRDYRDRKYHNALALKEEEGGWQAEG